MVRWRYILHKLEIERVPRLLDGRVVVETRRRKFRRRRRDVGELRILDERVPLHEVASERLDQDVVGPQRAESLGQRRRQQDGLVVPGRRKHQSPLYAVSTGRREAGQYKVRVRRGRRRTVPASQCISRVDGVPTPDARVKATTPRVYST